MASYTKYAKKKYSLKAVTNTILGILMKKTIRLKPSYSEFLNYSRV